MTGTSELKVKQANTRIEVGINRFARLPTWLINAGDRDKIIATLTPLIPEFSSGRLHLLDCSIEHIRYKSLYWTGRYEFLVDQGEGSPPKKVILSGMIFPSREDWPSANDAGGHFGEDDWYALLPLLHLELHPKEKEKVLDSLDLLIQPELAARFLEEHIRTRSPRYQELKIDSVVPNIVRYKPGSRCTIVYKVNYANESENDKGWPDLVIGKTYRGEKGKIAYDGMQALWDSPLGSGNIVSVAEPLAYIPDKHILIQGPVREEKTLKRLIEEAIQTGEPDIVDLMRDYLRQTAAGLVELHRSGVSYGDLWTWEDELGEVRDRVDRLAKAVPKLASAVDPLLERLSARAASAPADQVMPSHGSFRPAQVLVDHGKLGFIDFDSFRQAEPALDLALFLATLMNMALTIDQNGENKHLTPAARKHVWQARYEQYLAYSNEFIDEYQKSLPVSRERIILWETLDILMLVLHCWIEDNSTDLKPTIYLLRLFLQTHDITVMR